MEKMFYTEHIPVLLQEVLDGLELAPGMIVIDATLGGGGYTRAILERILPGGRLIAFDWDEEAVRRFKKRAETDSVLASALTSGALTLVHTSYADLHNELTHLGIESGDRIVADLGLSTDQLEESERGLSFRVDGPLDMRLNTKEKVTAARILSEWSETELATLFQTYGDEREGMRIARAIVAERMTKPLTRTLALASLVERSVSSKRRSARIHPATQVFQALRIAVNSERAHLERFLPAAIHWLKPGGRLALVAFHSGEDALVKHFFQKEARGCICGMVPCSCGRIKTLRLVTKKPIEPGAEEKQKNPRSRSAKLRIAEKI